VKPFWNDHLQKLWNEQTIAEREFLKSKVPQNKQDLRENYKQTQLLFGKYVRFYKRKFNRGQALKLEHLQTSNSQQFWKGINKLVPYRIKAIPMEVVMENGAVELRKERVVKKWELDFSTLYSGLTNIEDFDLAFSVLSVQVKENLELLWVITVDQIFI